MPRLFGPRPISNELARELIFELRFARTHGSFALINARLGSIVLNQQSLHRDLNQLKGKVSTMANEVENLTATVARQNAAIVTLTTEQGRIVGELRELSQRISDNVDLQKVGELTTELNAGLNKLDAANAALKAATDEVDTDGTHPGTAPVEA